MKGRARLSWKKDQQVDESPYESQQGHTLRGKRWQSRPHFIQSLSDSRNLTDNTPDRSCARWTLWQAGDVVEAFVRHPVSRVAHMALYLAVLCRSQDV